MPGRDLCTDITLAFFGLIVIVVILAEYSYFFLNLHHLPIFLFLSFFFTPGPFLPIFQLTFNSYKILLSLYPKEEGIAFATMLCVLFSAQVSCRAQHFQTYAN